MTIRVVDCFVGVHATRYEWPVDIRLPPVGASLCLANGRAMTYSGPDKPNKLGPCIFAAEFEGDEASHADFLIRYNGGRERKDHAAPGGQLLGTIVSIDFEQKTCLVRLTGDLPPPLRFTVTA